MHNNKNNNNNNNNNDNNNNSNIKNIAQFSKVFSIKYAFSVLMLVTEFLCEPKCFHFLIFLSLLLF